MTRQVWYDLEIGQNARIRHAHQVDQGRVTGFTVQLEVWHDHSWWPVVRYDGRHGFPHMDVYRRDGRKRKIWLGMSFADALTIADRDVREHAGIYLERFLRGDWP